MEAAAGYCCSPKILVRGATRRNPPSLVPGLTFRAFVSLKILSVPLSAPRRFCIAPLCSSSSPLVSPLSPETSHDGKEFVPVSSDIPEISEPTICVRFILKRECSVGEKFFLVGEDPALGSWEPSMAIPMKWSEGHTWSIEQDMPIGSKVQFKFIMKNASGEVKWQPGPDRVLNLWETDKTILVEEDWEAAEVQKVTEELPEEPFMQSPVAVAEEVKPDELAEIYDAVIEEPFMQSPVAVAEEVKPDELAEIYDSMIEEPFMQSPVAVAEEVKPDELAEIYDSMIEEPFMQSPVAVAEEDKPDELAEIYDPVIEEPFMQSPVAVAEEVKPDELAEIYDAVIEEPFMQSPVAVAVEVKPDELADIYDAVMGHFIENSEDPVSVPGLSSMSIIGAAGQISEEKQDETASEVKTGSTVGEHLTPIFPADDENVDIDIPQWML